MLYHTTYLSPWWGYPPPVLCCRSSGWCPHGGRSRSKPSHRPTASTGHRPPSGCYRALGSHDPLEEMDDKGDKSMGWRDEGTMKGGKTKFVGRKGHVVVPEWVGWGDLSSDVSAFSLYCLSCIISCLSEFLHRSASGDQPCQMSLHILNIFVWVRVSLINLGATSTVNIFRFCF